MSSISSTKPRTDFKPTGLGGPSVAATTSVPLSNAPAAQKVDGFSKTGSSVSAQVPSQAVAGQSAPQGSFKGPVALRMSQLDASHSAAKDAVTAKAHEAAGQLLEQHAATPGTIVKGDHPLLEGFGETLGMALGVVVTEALALIPSWNKAVLDNNGKPVSHVEGADRIGNHNILKRHQEVVGPQITALVEKMSPSALREVMEGLGRGATAAPGASYRLESAVADAFTKS